jgi:hypothetical protein
VSKLAEALSRFFAWLGALQGEAPILFWVIVVGCVALLVVLLVHVSWTLIQVVSVRRSDATVSATQQRKRLWVAYRAEAGRYAAAGQYTEAVRQLFLALVFWLDESGKIPFRPTLTNREYISFFQDHHAAAEKLRVLVDLLDANWYGQRPTARGEYENCLRLVESVHTSG